MTKNGNIAELDKCEYLDKETPRPGRSKSQSETILDKEKITSLPYVTDKGNLKKLNDQVKQFVIGNSHCKPKGPFLKDNYITFFLLFA